jgi:hypothetical protein
MEITYPDIGQSRPWQLANGLLVLELVADRMRPADSACLGHLRG